MTKWKEEGGRRRSKKSSTAKFLGTRFSGRLTAVVWTRRTGLSGVGRGAQQEEVGVQSVEVVWNFEVEE